MSLLRSFKIAWVFGRYRLDTLLQHSLLPFWLRWLVRLYPLRWFFSAKESEGRRLRLALEHLGPVFIKFGQILSTRRDLLPESMAEELAYLQDRVAPFDGQLAIARIEKELKQSISEAFASFESEALASASIAQVHAATLHSGESVVVKVIRPGIEKVIRQDIRLMRTLAGLLNRIPDGARLRPVEVVDEFQRTLLDELDLLREGANAATLRRNTLADGQLYVPEVFWDYTRRSVLVLERIHGIPISDIEQLQQAGVNFQKLAERGVQIFFSQVFRDSFFHADMHPGNVFVDATNPEDPTYIGIDCGIVGSLSRDDQNYLAQNLLAFFNRDYYRVAELHVESGWVPRDTRVHEFESAIRSVCEPIFEKPISEISFGVLLIRLFQTARRFNMTVQPQLVLLQKTLLNIEGLGRELYPQLDLWKTAKPFLEQWMKDQVGPKRVLSTLKQQGPGWIVKAPHLPDLVYDALTQMRTLPEFQRNLEQVQSDLQQSAQLQRTRRLRTGLGILGLAAIFLGPSVSMMAQTQWALWQWAVGAIALTLLLWP